MENELTMVKMDDIEGRSDHRNLFSSNPSNKIAGYGGTHNPKWTDEAIKKLINLWGERPSLYDTKNEAYFSKNKRREAMEEICEILDMGMQEVQLKMVSLRTYYGSQHRKKLAWENDASKKVPFTSRWQFWIPLQFLQDHMTQKQSDNKGSVEEESLSVSPSDARPYDIENDDMSGAISSKSRGTKRKTLDRASTFNSESIKNVEQAEETVERKTSIGVDHKMASWSEDELFVSILLQSLAKIEEGEAKEALKLEIQNLVFRTRFGPHRFIGGLNEAPQSFGGDCYPNGMYSSGNEFGTNHRDNSSDDELSVTNRRKAMNPKKSSQNDNLKESYSMVSVQPRYGQGDRGDV